ncbi:MAG TPA: hypothetical protein VKA21_09030 [Candidatus Binatia bacterium]|nr:hypothetical protein [Candidatus Binatia bacterium]
MTGRLAIAIAIAVTTATADPPPGWKTFRSDALGYEVSYPPDLELRSFVGGGSGELRDAATGERLADLEFWPPDQCPRERPGTTARALGVERAAAITQADGDDGSSSCGKPVKVTTWTSRRGVALYELGLTCREERRGKRRPLGRKEPTYFADVSQPWRARVLMLDPVGADPRMRPVRRRLDAKVVRAVLETVAAIPLPEPKAVCIEDLAPAP